MYFAYCIMIEIHNRNILCWWHTVLRAAFICHMAVLSLLESVVQMVGEHIKTEELIYAHPATNRIFKNV